MERGDIYIVSLAPTRGHEQQGRRPVLVVSPDAFNRVTKVPIVVPITTGDNFARIAGLPSRSEVRAYGREALFGVINPARSISARGAGRRLETVPATIIDEVLAWLAPLFE